MNKIKTLAKNTGSESLPVFLASVLISVIVDENNFSHAVQCKRQLCLCTD